MQKSQIYILEKIGHQLFCIECIVSDNLKVIFILKDRFLRVVVAFNDLSPGGIILTYCFIIFKYLSMRSQ